MERKIDLTTTSRIGSNKICEFFKTNSKEKKETIFTKKYSPREENIATHEIWINERLKHMAHKNITTYLGKEINNNRETLLNFEYSKLGSLFDYFKDFRNITNNIDVLRSLIKGIVEGLIAIHKMGIIHNDIKAENILIFEDSSGRIFPKIADFNSSLLYDAKNDQLITLLYEPEFTLKWEKPSFKYDYWCLGMLIYRMVYNELPYQINPLHVKYKLTSKSIPYSLQDLIDQLLTTDHNNRLCDGDILDHPFFKLKKQKNVFIQRKRNRAKKEIKK